MFAICVLVCQHVKHFKLLVAEMSCAELVMSKSELPIYVQNKVTHQSNNQGIYHFYYYNFNYLMTRNDKTKQVFLLKNIPCGSLSVKTKRDVSICNPFRFKMYTCSRSICRRSCRSSRHKYRKLPCALEELIESRPVWIE